MGAPPLTSAALLFQPRPDGIGRDRLPLPQEVLRIRRDSRVGQGAEALAHLSCVHGLRYVWLSLHERERGGLGWWTGACHSCLYAPAPQPFARATLIAQDGLLLASSTWPTMVIFQNAGERAPPPGSPLWCPRQVAVSCSLLAWP